MGGSLYRQRSLDELSPMEFPFYSLPVEEHRGRRTLVLDLDVRALRNLRC